LAYYNPAAVIPAMRLLLVRIISEVKSSSDNRLKEESTLMLSRFLRIPPLHNIVKPYAGILIKSIPLQGGDTRLVTASLESIGEICKVMQQAIAPWSDQLIAIIVSNMFDQSSRRKQVYNVYIYVYIYNCFYLINISRIIYIFLSFFSIFFLYL
jgi:FKBP12-rapamycin complex-associated protein